MPSALGQHLKAPPKQKRLGWATRPPVQVVLVASLVLAQGGLLSLQNLQDCFRIDREACRSLARGILLESIHECEGGQHAYDFEIVVVHEPVVVLIGRYIRPLVGVHSKIKYLRKPQAGKRFHPDIQVARRALLAEDKLPVVVPHTYQHAVVVEVEEVVARRRRLLASQIRKNVVAIEMNLEDLSARRDGPAFQQ